MALDAATKQELAEISALLDSNRVEQAMSLTDRLIRTMDLDRLVLSSPDLEGIIERFFPKRRRALAELLQQRLKHPSPEDSQRGEPLVPSTSLPGVPSTASYASKLDELRDHHIFQWTTFYRDTVAYIFKDLLRRLRDEESWDPLLGAVSGEMSKHSREIFSRGLTHLGQRGLAKASIETKSIGGLQRFLYLIIELYLERRLEVPSARDAKILREVTSAMLTGVLRGSAEFFATDLETASSLFRYSKTWIHALGFMTGADASGLTGEPAPLPDGVINSVVPTLLALDRMSNKHQAPDFLLTRLSRAIGEPARLEITITSARRTQSLDLSIAVFYQEEVSDPRVIQEALSGGTTIVVSPVTAEVRTWAESLAIGSLVEAPRGLATTDSDVHNLAERIAAVLEEQLAASREVGEGQLLVRNFARDFPLEDPVLRRLFLVQRHSVKRLLETFERGTGIHLWCSVRRSGKTTAASDLAGMTGRSLVVMQTMDQQPHQPELNVLYERVVEATRRREVLDSDFFASVVKECTLSSTSIQVDEKKLVLVIDEYETLFGLLAAVVRIDPDLRFLVVQPLLSQMVGFAVTNLLIFMGQRPDAHYILMAQNQLSPLVKQDKFPLFEHYTGGLETEFAQFLRRVLTEKMLFAASFVDAVFQETRGHPYLTVNLMVDFCQWLIENRAPAESEPLAAERFSAFTKERLSQGALQRSTFYSFFQQMLAEYLSDRARTQEPWLHAVAMVLRRISRDHVKTLSCSVTKFKQLAEDVVSNIGMTPEQLLTAATMANFLDVSGGNVSPAIRLIGRLAATVQREAN